MDQAVAVLDVGKTHSKLCLVSDEGVIEAKRTRANAVHARNGLRFLDVLAIEDWLIGALRGFARDVDIRAIVPVAHGATAALIGDNALAVPVLDYEATPPDDVRDAYRRERDPFGRTASPALPSGLNLGLQLFWQEQLYPDLWPRQARVLTWPQYWAWRLSGVAASEVTSLGCHTDLWFPYDNTFSDLALRRGWAGRFPTLRPAGSVLGTLAPRVVAASGAPKGCEVLCGIHDSNAALIAARGFAEMQDRPFVLVSTGTWFVSLKSGGEGRVALDPDRDTLANVDVDARPTPSARFMGGREYEAILGASLGAKPSPEDAAALLKRGVATRPSFVPGCGPFPLSRGEIIGEVRSSAERAALASLHLAFLENACLDLIDAEGPILIEGRFASDEVFAGALAALRGQPVYRCRLADGVALGAARLASPLLALGSAERVAPLSLDLAHYVSVFATDTGSHTR